MAELPRIRSLSGSRVYLAYGEVGFGDDLAVVVHPQGDGRDGQVAVDVQYARGAMHSTTKVASIKIPGASAPWQRVRAVLPFSLPRMESRAPCSRSG